jgi:hypothetical protein
MTTFSYYPMLELRPAEMLALQELPNKTKDTLFPIFGLRPWGVSQQLSKSIERLNKAFGSRMCFLEIAEDYTDPSKVRPVHGQLKDLRSSANGYSNWFNFLSLPEHSHFIPSLQFGGSQNDFTQQIKSLHSLGRGLLVHLDIQGVKTATTIAALVAQGTGGGATTTFLLDYGKQSQTYLAQVASIQLVVETVRQQCPSANVVLSASSFPESFTSITSQRIYERQVYDAVSKKCVVAYSDRGSTRAEKQLGGGGLPAPRIDYPTKDEWRFFRQSSPLSSAFLGYKAQSTALMGDPVWVSGLKLWGVQMIERTAAGDVKDGISSPNRSTAARINIHLHRQAFYSEESSFLSTDEDWND